MEKMIDQIFIDLDEGDHITFGFQGGRTDFNRPEIL